MRTAIVDEKSVLRKRDAGDIVRADRGVAYRHHGEGLGLMICAREIQV